ncbi:hypothetical protein MPER_13813 [Moniliophthora perniciosa FA553]|nr:hypothetical protein MPER_13813 [Moniliophthora perniciosa FA553]
MDSSSFVASALAYCIPFPFRRRPAAVAVAAVAVVVVAAAAVARLALSILSGLAEAASSTADVAFLYVGEVEALRYTVYQHLLHVHGLLVGIEITIEVNTVSIFQVFK